MHLIKKLVYLIYNKHIKYITMYLYIKDKNYK
jgi:hypothetical protein